eukprot:604622-Rhodomonas_salina.2
MDSARAIAWHEGSGRCGALQPFERSKKYPSSYMLIFVSDTQLQRRNAVPRVVKSEYFSTGVVSATKKRPPGT